MDKLVFSAREKVLNAMTESLPAFFPIKDNGIFSPKTIHNLCSQGIGPEIVKIKSQNYLERDSFMRWVDQHGGKRRGRKRKVS